VSHVLVKKHLSHTCTPSTLLRRAAVPRRIQAGSCGRLTEVVGPSEEASDARLKPCPLCVAKKLRTACVQSSIIISHYQSSSPITHHAEHGRKCIRNLKMTGRTMKMMGWSRETMFVSDDATRTQGGFAVILKNFNLHLVLG
jgi:hypothetical protein